MTIAASGARTTRRLPGLLALTAATMVIGCGALPIDALPLGPGTHECVGVPAAQCAALAAERSGPQFRGVIGYRIRCTSSACTETSGTVEMLVLFHDGTTERGTAFWVDEAQPSSSEPPGPT